MRAIAIINQKGGCGKTTSAINLSAVLARAGKRVILIDMDPQGHCAAGLGIPEQRIELDIGDAMLAIGQKPIDPAKLLWRAVRNLDLAPSRMKLAGLEAARGGLADMPDKERRLAQVLEKFSSDYDIAVIDCPPSIGLLTYNALACSDMVVIPVETGFFSLQGATRQVNTVKTLSKRLGVAIPVWLLPTLHDAKNTVAADLLEELHRRFKDRVAPVTIRMDQRLREAASFGQTIIDYAPGSLGSEDYGRLGVWTLEHLQTRVALPPEQREVGEHAGPIITTTHAAPVAVGAHAGTIVTTEHAKQSNGQANGHANGMGDGHAHNDAEVKPVSRAEDVARRAQEFLRRIALGRGGHGAGNGTGNGTGNGLGNTGGTTPAPAPATDYASTMTGGAESATATLTRAPAEMATPAVLPARQVLTVTTSATPAVQPIAPATQRLLGVRETSQGMLFVQPIAIKEGGAKTIAIAGSFNDWSATTHIMKRNDSLGIHELCVRLPAGKFSYRLVVDGVWQNDPHNPNTEPNPFGEVNNIGYVGQA